MKRITITINNTSMTKERAIKEAMEVHDQTGVEVIVESMLGDTVLWLKQVEI